MSQPDLILREQVGRILRLTLNNPDKRNAMTYALVEALADALRQADRDPGLRAVVLDAAGEHFCAGGDLEEFAGELDLPGDIAREPAQVVPRVARPPTDEHQARPRPLVRVPLPAPGDHRRADSLRRLECHSRFVRELLRRLERRVRLARIHPGPAAGRDCTPRLGPGEEFVSLIAPAAKSATASEDR